MPTDFAPLSEPDADRRAEPAIDGPICLRCGRRSILSSDGTIGSDDRPPLFACPTDGEFYVDYEGFSIRQVFLDDSAPTHAVPVEVAELDEEEEALF